MAVTVFLPSKATGPFESGQLRFCDLESVYCARQLHMPAGALSLSGAMPQLAQEIGKDQAPGYDPPPDTVASEENTAVFTRPEGGGHGAGRLIRQS